MNRWIDSLERKFGRFAIPNLAWVVVGTQAFGLMAVHLNSAAAARMSLHPIYVMQGEIWRLITFLAVPDQSSLIFAIFYLYILYFIVNALESEWGAFKTTLYIFIAWVISIAFSFVFQVELRGMQDIYKSLFFAVAVLFPEVELQLFLIFPVKMKWLGLFALALLLWRFFASSGIGKIYLLLIYSNYLIFFGGYHLNQLNAARRRKKFRDQWK